MPTAFILSMHKNNTENYAETKSIDFDAKT